MTSVRTSLKSRTRLRIGTRGSKLARWQAEWVAKQLAALGSEVEIVEIVTHGDSEQIVPVARLGSPGAFTKEIQLALLRGEIDVAIHSLKDLPTEPVDALVLAAVPQRESAQDALVVANRLLPTRAAISPAESVARIQSVDGLGLPDSFDLEQRRAFVAYLAILPQSSRVGTGSLRRQAQIRHVRPDIRVEDIRGNVDTRLGKLDEGQFDALILAEAGLRRLGMADRIFETLPISLMVPAVGQGALAIECREADTATRAALEPLDDAPTRAAVTAERALLNHLRGGCLAPVGAWGRFDGGELLLSAVVLSADGVERLDASGRAAPNEAEALGRRVADALLARGAQSLIAAARER